MNKFYRSSEDRKGDKRMSEVMIFENAEFGSVRTVNVAGEPWFVAADVCRALEIDRSQTRRVDDDEKAVYSIQTPGGMQEASFVNEPGLYSLVLGSRKPEAKEFKRWITHDVIPSIRKSGGYIAGQESMTDAELMAKALLVAQKQIEDRNLQIERMRPKEIFCDAVSASKTSILIGDLAKILKQNGVDTGQKRLFAWLRDNGYLIKQKGMSYNMPTQRSMEKGLFEVKETAFTHSDGHISISKTVKVTGKGQVYFVDTFLRKGGEECYDPNTDAFSC